MIKLLLQLILGVAIVFSTSCTRETAQTVTVGISTAPGAQSGAVPTAVIINVSGNGFQTMYYSWDRCHEDDPNDCPSGTLAPPSQVTFQIPKGTGRLFQVLSAYDTATGVVFQYGDALKTISSSQETVPVALAPVGGGGKKFDFGGRFSNTSSGLTTPSGLIKTYYTPPGRPSMFIESNYMFNGWFKLFGIDNAGFDYNLVKSDGTEVPIFTDMNLNSTSFPETQKVLRVQKPDYITVYDANTNGVLDSGEEYYEEYASDLILGFFTDASYGTVAACYPSSNPMLPRMIDSAYPGLDLGVPECGSSVPCGLTTGGWLMDWDVGASATHTAGVFNRNSASSGEANNVGVCFTPPSEHSATLLRFDPHAIGKSFDAVYGMLGPFKYYDTGGAYYDFAKATYDGSNDVTVNFKYLPGITVGAGSAFDGVHIYHKADQSDSFSEDMTYFDCSELSSNGFAGPVNHTAVNASESVVISVGAMSVTNWVQLIICPYKQDGANVKYLIGNAIYTNDYN